MCFLEFAAYFKHNVIVLLNSFNELAAHLVVKHWEKKSQTLRKWVLLSTAAIRTEKFRGHQKVSNLRTKDVQVI